MTLRVVLAVANVSLVVVYALGSGLWVSSGGPFYRALVRPVWQPPDWVFGLAWPYNFAALIAAGVAVAVFAGSTQKIWWTGLFAASVVAALAWARLFYVSESLTWAAVALSAGALLTVPLVALAWQTRIWAGAILLPYQLWLFVASSLSVGYAVLNQNK